MTVIPNGVDTELFRPQQYSTDEKLRQLKNLLVDAPRGSDQTGVEGSIRYNAPRPPQADGRTAAG